VKLREVRPDLDGHARSAVYNLAVHRGAVARRSPVDPRRAVVVRVQAGARKHYITLPRRLVRALGWHRRDYLHVALTDDGRGLVVSHFARL